MKRALDAWIVAHVDAQVVNVITRWVVLVVLIWIPWELVVLYLRTLVPGVRTISQEAMLIAYRGLPALAFGVAGMCAHWWITWGRLPLSGTAGAVAAVTWWAMLGTMLVANLIWPRHETWPAWWAWVCEARHSALIGAVSAWLLFGQRTPPVVGGVP